MCNCPNQQVVSPGQKLNINNDLENNALDVVNHPRQIVKITVEDRLEKYDLMRIKDIDKIENI